MGPEGLSRASITSDEAFDLLASPLRRCIVRYLLKESPPGNRGELANRIAENEPVEFTPLWIAMAHSHLPRLADAGIIEYDNERGTIALAQERDALEWLLDIIDEWEKRDSWQAVTRRSSR